MIASPRLGVLYRQFTVNGIGGTAASAAEEGI